MKARLYNKYVSEVVPALKDKHKYANPHQIPQMVKIVVNMGVSASLEKNAVEDAAKDLGLITGRKPAPIKRDFLKVAHKVTAAEMEEEERAAMEAAGETASPAKGKKKAPAGA